MYVCYLSISWFLVVDLSSYTTLYCTALFSYVLHKSGLSLLLYMQENGGCLALILRWYHCHSIVRYISVSLCVALPGGTGGGAYHTSALYLSLLWGSFCCSCWMVTYVCMFDTYCYTISCLFATHFTGAHTWALLILCLIVFLGE